MQTYKFVNALELDGKTVKKDTYSMPYSDFKGVHMQEIQPTEVDRCMLMKTISDEGYFRSSVVKDIEIKEIHMKVMTENTIYEFEIIT